MKLKLTRPLLLPAIVLFACLGCSFGALAKEPDAPPTDSEQSQRSVEVARRWLRQVGQLRVASSSQRAHSDVLSAFRSVVTKPSKSTVEVYSGDERIAMGTIVDRSGYVLTKASELKGALQCHLADGRQLPAKIVGLAKRYDLAMLKIDANDLLPIQWSEAKSPAVGSWLATTSLKEIPTAIGVVSVAPRRIAATRGIMGIMLADDRAGPRVDRVMSGSGAEKAGLQVNDIIVSVNGVEVENRRTLIKLIQEFRPGDKVKLSVRRDDRRIDLTVVLGTDISDVGRKQRNFQDTLGGPLSERRTDFPSVLQHDTVLLPKDCGGPIVNLDGKAVGVNIARAGRVASYTLPAGLVKPLLADLMSGKLAPSADSQTQKTATLDEPLE